MDIYCLSPFGNILKKHSALLDNIFVSTLFPHHCPWHSCFLFLCFTAIDAVKLLLKCHLCIRQFRHVIWNFKYISLIGLLIPHLVSCFPKYSTFIDSIQLSICGTVKANTIPIGCIFNIVLCDENVSSKLLLPRTCNFFCLCCGHVFVQHADSK